MNCKKGRCCRLSIRFKIAKVAVKLMGMKKLFALPQDELLKKVEKMNETRGFRMTSRRGFGYEDRLINGSHCLKIRTGDAPSQCALLFLFGGGYILGPDDGDVKLAERMGAKSGRDIWFPYYPLCTRQSVKCAFDAVYAVLPRNAAGVCAGEYCNFRLFLRRSTGYRSGATQQRSAQTSYPCQG